MLQILQKSIFLQINNWKILIYSCQANNINGIMSLLIGWGQSIDFQSVKGIVSVLLDSDAAGVMDDIILRD